MSDASGDGNEIELGAEDGNIPTLGAVLEDGIVLALGTELGKERQCVSPLRMSLTASADTAERLCFIDALIEVHNSCELFSDDLEQNSCREGWFIFVTHAAWLVFVAREQVHRCFLVVPPS